MSTRARRNASSAAASTSTPTAAASSSSSAASKPQRASRRRKASATIAAEDDNNENVDADADEEEEESSAIIERPTKRTRRATPSPTPPARNSRSKKKSAATPAKKSKTSSSRKKRVNAASDEETKEEEDEDEEMEEEQRTEEQEEQKEADDDAMMEEEDESDATSTFELLFSKPTTIPVVPQPEVETAASASSTAAADDSSISSSTTPLHLPAIPRDLLLRCCDYMTGEDLVTRIALLSHSGYSTSKSYAALVQREMRRCARLDPHGKEFDMDEVATSNGARIIRRRVGVRQSFNYLIMKSPKNIRLLLASPLRFVIAGMDCAEPIDERLLAEIAERLPNIRTFSLILATSSQNCSSVTFPPLVRHLNVCVVSRGKTLPAYEKHFMQMAHAVAKIKYLNRLFIDPPKDIRTNELPEECIKPLVKCKYLRTLRSGYPHLLRRCVAELRAIPTLTSIVENAHCNTMRKDIYSVMLKSPCPWLDLTDIHFDQTLTQTHVKALSTVPTLRSLRPKFWLTKEVTFLKKFPKLKSLDIDTLTAQFHFSFGGQVPRQLLHTPTAVINKTHLVSTLTQLTNLQQLKLRVAGLKNEHLEEVLRALPLLHTFSVGSREVTSIACFSAIPELRNRLDVLAIELPNVPRDDVVHLYSLRGLVSLSINGSFTESLYAKQLGPFVSIPASPMLPYLMSFEPRSSAEPVPPAPFDSEASAIAAREFDARVRSGARMSPAETMNTSQTSLILQFLTLGEFTFAARTCRSWRSAASLPSAWSNTRMLHLQSDDNGVAQAILPSLPLWRNVRLIAFQIMLESPTFFLLKILQPELAKNTKQSDVEKFAAPLKTLTGLLRLDTLHLTVPDIGDTPQSKEKAAVLEETLRTLNTRLHKLYLSTQYPLSFTGCLENLRFLLFEVYGEDSFPRNIEWEKMLYLEELNITTSHLPINLGVELRKLSNRPDAKFRSLTLRLKLDDTYRELEYESLVFVKQLGGVGMIEEKEKKDEEEKQREEKNPEDEAKHYEALEKKYQAFLTSGDERYTESCSQLTTLRIQYRGMPSLKHIIVSRFDVPVAAILKMDNLTELAVSGIFGLPNFNIDLAAQIALHVKANPSKEILPHLTELDYTAAFNATLPPLISRFTSLTTLHLRLMATQEEVVIASPEILKLWIDAWPRLEVLNLDGVEIQGDDLHHLEAFHDLKTLRIRTLTLSNSTNNYSPSQFLFLQRMTKLEELSLMTLPKLLLEPREWMEKLQAEVEKEMELKKKEETKEKAGEPTTVAAEDASSSPSPSPSVSPHAASSTTPSDGDGDTMMSDTPATASSSDPKSSPPRSLVSILASIPRLRLFEWCASPPDFLASIEYTVQQSYVRQRRGGLTEDQQLQRQKRETAREVFAVIAAVAPPSPPKAAESKETMMTDASSSSMIDTLEPPTSIAPQTRPPVTLRYNICLADEHGRLQLAQISFRLTHDCVNRAREKKKQLLKDVMSKSTGTKMSGSEDELTQMAEQLEEERREEKAAFIRAREEREKRKTAMANKSTTKKKSTKRKY